MSFNPTAYNTRQYEVASIGDSPTVIQPGTALKCSGIPTGIFSPDFYYKVGVCAPTDNVFGVVSSQGSAITCLLYTSLVELISLLIYNI